MAIGKVNHRAVVEIVFDDAGRSRSDASLQAKGSEKGFSAAEKMLAVRLRVPVQYLGAGLRKAATMPCAPPLPRSKAPNPNKYAAAVEYQHARRLGVSVDSLRKAMDQLYGRG